MSGMRSIRPRLQFRINVTAEPWRNTVGQDDAKKLKKLKQAQANVTVKVSPVVPEVFEGLLDLICNLQPADGGRHVTRYQQLAGSRGGEKKEYLFKIISGSLTAMFFKTTFIDP
eukprot:6211930-Pleurochrysis_carterae.AAC.3